MKSVKKWLTLIPTLGILAASAQGFAAAAEETSPQQNAVFVGEREDLREPNVKYFAWDDGSCTAVVYDAPVHYQKDGRLEDIDNTLRTATLVGDPLTDSVKADAELSPAERLLFGAERQNTAYYENTASDFRVQLPQELERTTPVMIRYQEHTVRFLL